MPRRVAALLALVALAAALALAPALAGCGGRGGGPSLADAPAPAPGSAPGGTAAPADPAPDDAAPSAPSTAADRRAARRAELRRLRGTRTVPGALRRAWLAGAIGSGELARDRATYAAARAALGRLTGARRAGLAGAVGALEELAGRRALSAGRVRPALTTLERNVAFWRFRPLPVAGQRFSNGRDPLVLQAYPGQGLQIQWVATWGRVNAFAAACLDRPRRCDRPRLRGAVERLVALGSVRGGARAWEGLFAYAQGRPGWVSGLVQATAVQALARSRVILGDRRYGRIALSAMALLQRPPPVGVAIRAPGGRFELLYSFAPGLQVLNAHLQAVNALRTADDLLHSRRAHRLYAQTEPAARAALRRADTGAWTRYSLGGAESTLGYHQLVVGFLRGLCARTRRAAYCDARARLQRYERQPPRLAIGAVRGARATRATTIAFALSKVSDLRVTATGPAGTQPVAALRLPRGGHRVSWIPPRRGRFVVRIVARGPSGPEGSATRAVRVGTRPGSPEARRAAAARRRAEARRRAAEARRERARPRRQRPRPRR